MTFYTNQMIFSRAFECAISLIVTVNINEAVAFFISPVPAEKVNTAPSSVAPRTNAVFTIASHCQDVLTEVVDTVIIFYIAIFIWSINCPRPFSTTKSGF